MCVADDDAGVVLQVLRPARHRMILEIGSGRHGDPPEVAYFLGDQPVAARFADANGDVDIVLVQVDERVGHAQLDVDSG